MKKNLKKVCNNGFTWSVWIKPSNITSSKEFHIMGWNFGDKFDGFHIWDTLKITQRK